MSKSEEYRLHSINSIGRLPLSEQVYLILKQAILTGALQPQVKLNEVKIAEQLNVSATPVREAFRKLAKDNLVVIKPWKGVTVKGYTPEEIISMYQCREVMEGLAARLSATEATDEQRQELADMGKDLMEEKDPETRVHINSRFHSLIVLSSKNERILDFVSDFTEMVNRDMYISTTDEERTVSCEKEHNEIIEAILQRDADLAEATMRKHIREAFVFKRAHAELKTKLQK